MSNQRSVVQQINEQKDFLLECANSLLKWYMFSGINPVRGMLTRGGQSVVPHGFL